jgi:hypothetical protein
MSTQGFAEDLEPYMALFVLVKNAIILRPEENDVETCEYDPKLEASWKVACQGIKTTLTALSKLPRGKELVQVFNKLDKLVHDRLASEPSRYVEVGDLTGI